jgi:hypothetical protein
MSETQWAHTLHISLNQEKPDRLVSQTGWFDLGRWAPTASFQIPDVPVFKIGCSNFYLLVFNGLFLLDKYKSFPSPSFGGCWCHPQNTFIISLCELSPTPLCEDLVIYEKIKVSG